MTEKKMSHQPSSIGKRLESNRKAASINIEAASAIAKIS